MSKPETMMIDDVKYVRADSVAQDAQELKGMKYCIIRSYGAGVFAGYVKEQKSELNGINVTLIDARRIWYWSGACSLSQLAVDGSCDLGNCKISVVVKEQFIANVIEIIPTTERVRIQLQGASIWKK